MKLAAKELVKLGAKVRIQELREEIAELERLVRNGGPGAWTRTPEGRAHMSKIAKAHWRKFRAEKRHAS